MMRKALIVLLALVGLFALGLVTEDSEERRHRVEWESTLVPCYVDPRTGDYAHTPCMSGSEVRR